MHTYIHTYSVTHACLYTYIYTQIYTHKKAYWYPSRYIYTRTHVHKIKSIKYFIKQTNPSKEIDFNMYIHLYIEKPLEPKYMLLKQKKESRYMKVTKHTQTPKKHFKETQTN